MEKYYILPLFLAMPGITLITFALKRVWVLTGLVILIVSGVLTLMTYLWERQHPIEKPIYAFICKNLEDSQIDTIYSYDERLENHVWVNMDSMFVNPYDKFATKYMVVKRIK